MPTTGLIDSDRREQPVWGGTGAIYVGPAPPHNVHALSETLGPHTHMLVRELALTCQGWKATKAHGKGRWKQGGVPTSESYPCPPGSDAGRLREYMELPCCFFMRLLGNKKSRYSNVVEKDLIHGKIASYVLKIYLERKFETLKTDNNYFNRISINEKFIGTWEYDIKNRRC